MGLRPTSGFRREFPGPSDARQLSRRAPLASVPPNGAKPRGRYSCEERSSRSARPSALRRAWPLAQDKTFELRSSRTGCRRRTAAEGAGGLGFLGREGLGRHHQVQGLSLAAARQGVRPLRHGARRHRRPHYINPGYQPGRFPIIGAGKLPFLVSNAKGGSRALDAWYRKHAEKEMKDVKFCLAFMHDPGSFHSKTKKSRCRATSRA